MKRLFLVLAVTAGFISCDRETVIVVEGDECETCQGANISLSPQTKSTDVDRDGIYAWVDVITVVATDDTGVDYGDEFQLVDDNSGADGFYLNSVPVNEEIDFSASTTSLTSTDNGQYLETIADPNELGPLQGRFVYAEYATDAPVTQYIVNGDNDVFLDMYTDFGRIISSFQLDSRFDSYDPQGNPDYKVVVTRGSETMEAGGTQGVTNYWNDINSVEGATQSYLVELVQVSNGDVLTTRNITETVIGSTSVTNKYVVGLDIALSSSVEVFFSWQPWTEIDGTDETQPTTSPNGLDCDACGAVTNWSPNGSYALTGDTVLEDVNLVVAGDLNLNGHTLTVTCGSVTVSGNFNGGGTLIAAGGLVVTGATQNNPTILVNECF